MSAAKRRVAASDTLFIIEADAQVINQHSLSCQQRLQHGVARLDE